MAGSSSWSAPLQGRREGEVMSPTMRVFFLLFGVYWLGIASTLFGFTIIITGRPDEKTERAMGWLLTLGALVIALFLMYIYLFG